MDRSYKTHAFVGSGSPDSAVGAVYGKQISIALMMPASLAAASAVRVACCATAALPLSAAREQPRPIAGRIGIDEIAIRKGHTYRIVVSDLLRGRPIWFGGKDRSEASMGEFYARLGKKKNSRIRLAVMDMWKPFRLATAAHAPQRASGGHGIDSHFSHHTGSSPQRWTSRR